MPHVLRFLKNKRCKTSPWNDEVPIRQELFGIERLEQHAESLALAQQTTATPPPFHPYINA